MDEVQVQLIGGFADGRIVKIPGDHNVWRVEAQFGKVSAARTPDTADTEKITTIETYRRSVFHCSKNKKVILWICERVCNKEDIVNYYETRNCG